MPIKIIEISKKHWFVEETVNRYLKEGWIIREIMSDKFILYKPDGPEQLND